jgi:signal transduction histidine kinase
MLHDTLASRRDEILARWKESVSGRIAPESMPALELLDHFPIFLNQVIESLRAQAECDDPPCAKTAANHGEQRLRLGFSLDAVVREYEALREVIEDTAADARVPISSAEARRLSRSITDGIAAAVSEYARQRDAEIRRQHNEHIGFITHELRNPLGTASLAVDMLINEGHLPTALQPTRALMRALEQMKSLIDHALRDARMTSGVELQPVHTTLGSLLEEAELMVGTDAKVFGVTLHLQVERDGDLYVDIRLVRSALSNLVQNAIKYSNRGGVVEMRGKVDDTHARIEIEDCCGGLEVGEIERAFTPFVRLDDEKPGFGLGLAIAKQAIGAHGGTISVQNLPGKGCIFAVELPHVKAMPARPPARD